MADAQQFKAAVGDRVPEDQQYVLILLHDPDHLGLVVTLSMAEHEADFG